MGVSTTHRINLSMWILIYSFSDTYYVWAACDLCGFVALGVRISVVGANKVKGSMSWFLGTNVILASKHYIA